MSQYGVFGSFCRNTGNLQSTLPVCNLFTGSPSRNGFGFDSSNKACNLTGLQLSNGGYLGNLGSILLAGLAILTTLGLLWRSNRKKAAVGRREMQLFLIGYIIISICEIFTVGWFPLNGRVRIAFSAVHVASIVATSWILLMNGAVGYQLIDDGTALSLALIFGSAAALFIGTGYIALDTGYAWTNFFQVDTQASTDWRSYSLYTLYQLVPLVFLVLFFILEAVLVLRVLGEVRPMFFLVGAALLFAIGQIFQYVVSKYICSGTSGKINGGLFETLFTLLSVVLVWVFWASITETDFVFETSGASTYT